VINEGAERRIFVNGGFADVTPEGLTVLAEEAIDLADVDPAQLEQQLKNAHEDLRDANTDERKLAAQATLSRLETMRAAMTR
jgi:F-type H+-transporting ATPase subunit epsilon